LPIEQRFGESSPLSIGVEEEMMLLDAATLGPVAAVRDLLADAEGVELPGTLKTELHASVVELNTVICDAPDRAVEALRALREAAAGLLEQRGRCLAAAGSHPFAEPEELPIADERRYQEFVGYAGVTARRQGVNGIHVHVGMPSATECMTTLETILPWLPLVLALSANSPYLAGRATGLASNRAEILAQLPRSGAPPAFDGYADWEDWVERFIRTGLASDYTQFWWDARPHPRFGTLEVRMPDQPTNLAVTAAFTALVQALCVTVVEDDPPEYDPPGRGLYQQNRWGALRFGLEAQLFHPSGDRVAKASELADELIERVRPAAERLGSAELLAGFDLTTTEGERQLQVRREDGLTAVCADLVSRTLSSAE
jgi:carboxylate-amine ligase